MGIDLSPEALSKAKFRGPVAFYDGRGGWARQDFECVAEPRFGYFWQRDNRQDRGKQAYMVDGKPVADLTEAARLLALPADPASPSEARKREIEDFNSSPQLSGTATRALSEARCNGDASPFGTVRAWNQRANHSWHVGINAYAQAELEAGREWPSWLYQVKDAAYEMFRATYLFAADREKDTELKCTAFGKSCASCPILREIEGAMVAQRTAKFPCPIEDSDIDAAKIMTCIGHTMHSQRKVIDGAFFTTAEDRKGGFF